MWYFDASVNIPRGPCLIVFMSLQAGWGRMQHVSSTGAVQLQAWSICLRSAGRDFKADFLIDKQSCSVKKSSRYVNKIRLFSVAIVMASTKRLNNSTLTDENAAKRIQSDDNRVSFAVKFFVKLRWLTINRPPQSFPTMMRPRKIYSLPIKIW